MKLRDFIYKTKINPIFKTKIIHMLQGFIIIVFGDCEYYAIVGVILQVLCGL
jgi:hypothetical protein